MDIKRCCTCKQYKPFSEFCRSRRSSDGYRPQCKKYCRAYSGTEARKTSQRKYSQSAKGRRSRQRAIQKYALSPKGRQAMHRLNQKKKREHPERIKAMRFLNCAVRSGKIHKPQECMICGKKAKVDGHHHKGYAEENALDVLWLCRKCHAQLHQEKIIEGER